ncbi:MAG: SDR family NAD(P)-dependent oxidoreductase [Deltaproteobacteria bacterium]|nr:SDR family NAD(P)-dependent oxidoreductase [Deltaproteobacteria bacterium]
MKEFKDKVAVITGAASGIGRAIAERCALEGMKVVLADVEQKALKQTEDEMNAKGATVLAVTTDVSKAADVEALAQKSLDRFGAVHLLCNNAGVASFGTIWEYSLADWEWILGVNLWGLIHGIRFFVPAMLERNTEGHIVNTASMGGLFSPPYNGIYAGSKHAVVAISEVLHTELALKKSKIKVSVLCPAIVKTRMKDAERNRPPELRNPPDQKATVPESMKEGHHGINVEGETAEEMADQVFGAIRDEKFYILPHPDFRESIGTRFKNIMEERDPTLPRGLLQRLGIIE